MKYHARIRRPQQLGVTLAELLTTLAIGAILISIGVPSYQGLTLSNSQAAEVNEFVSGLNLARSEAITKNERVVICASKNGLACEIATEWHEGWLAFGDTNGNSALDPGEPVHKVTGASRKTTSSSGEFPNAITFRPNGRAMAATPRDNTGQFTFCDKRGAEHARVIVIDASGRPRSSKYKIDGSKPTC